MMCNNNCKCGGCNVNSGGASYNFTEIPVGFLATYIPSVIFEFVQAIASDLQVCQNIQDGARLQKVKDTDSGTAATTKSNKRKKATTCSATTGTRAKRATTAKKTTASKKKVVKEEVASDDVEVAST